MQKGNSFCLSTTFSGKQDRDPIQVQIVVLIIIVVLKGDVLFNRGYWHWHLAQLRRCVGEYERIVCGGVRRRAWDGDSQTLIMCLFHESNFKEPGFVKGTDV